MGSSDGLDPDFAERLTSLIEASGGKVWIESGYRSEEEQQVLWSNKAAELGLPPDIGCDDPRTGPIKKWVACPGHSHHNMGIAADIGGDFDWLAQNAAAYGLYLPMSWEPWHVEPLGTRDPTTGVPTNPSAYTTPPEVRYKSQPLASNTPVDPFSIVRHMLGGEPDSLFGAQLDPLFTHQPLAALSSTLDSMFTSATPFQVPDTIREGRYQELPTFADESRSPSPTSSLPDRAIGGGDIDRFMAAIRAVESSGYYGAYNRDSGASGAYQFMPGTWGYYQGYAEARDAPPEVQDALARRMMLDYFAQYQNWSDVAAAWVSGPSGNWASADVQKYIGKVIGYM